MNDLHDKETQYNDDLLLNQCNTNRYKRSNKASSSYSNHHHHHNDKKSTNDDSMHSIHKSTFYYMNKRSNEDNMSQRPRSVTHKKRRRFNNEDNAKALKSPLFYSIKKFCSTINNNISIVFNQSTVEHENDNSSRSNYYNAKILSNPFDSLDYRSKDMENSIEYDNEEEEYRLFNDLRNTKANQKSSNNNLIYEAPKYSNGLLNKLRIFNPNEEEKEEERRLEEDNRMMSNNKLISAFTINNHQMNHNKDNKADLNASLNSVGFESISLLKSYKSKLNNSYSSNTDQTLKAVQLDSICNHIKQYSTSFRISETQNEISNRFIFLINNNELSSMISKINSSSFNSLQSHRTPLTQSELDLITETLNKEYYANTTNFALFESITSNLHKSIFYNDTSSMGPKRPIEDLRQYLINSPYNTALMLNLSKNISQYRNVQCDGDGFYRAFAFALMEHLIITNNQSQLRLISYDLTTKTKVEFKYNDIKIKKEPLIIVTKIILTHMENNQLFEAYRVFTNAFISEPDFELGLIKYIKIAIADCIKLHFSALSKENQLALFPKKYFSHEYNCLDVIDYVNERVLRMKYEPDVCVYFFAPISFKVNIQLFAIEKDKVFNKTFYCDYTQSSSPMICLLYTSSRYYIGYYRTQMQRKEGIHYNNIIINSKMKKAMGMTKRFITITKKVHCDKCKAESERIVPLRFKSISFCKECLIKGLNKELELLLDNFTKDQYNYKEYYLQPMTISLTPDKSIQLYDDDFIELLGHSIPNLILERLSVRCIECNMALTIESESKCFVLNCDCYYCYNCIIKKVSSLRVEAASKEIIELYCHCGMQIKLSQVINIVLNDSSKSIEHIKESLVTQMIKRCFICLRPIRSTSSKYKFEVMIHRSSSTSECYTHVICSNCLILNQSRNCYVSECSYCNEYHSFPMVNSTKKTKQFCNVNCCIIV